jgi:photosystem II stability/assembly factor-like uncharacterized protein
LVLWIILKIISFRIYPFFLLTLLFFYNGIIQAQWVQTDGTNDKFISSLVVSGTNIFAGTNGDGVFLSTNNGTNWTQVNNGLKNTFVSSITAVGTSIFAGTDSGGVYNSTDNGSNWAEVNNGLTITYNNPLTINSLCTNGTGVFAFLYNGLFRTADSGKNWTSLGFDLMPGYITALAASGINIYVGTMDGSAVLSTNNGETWVLLFGNGDLSSIVNLVASDSFVFLKTGDGTNLFSINNGTNWSPENSNLIFNNVQSIAVIGNNIFAGTKNGGVFLSTNNGTDWAQVNNGLANNFIRSIVISGNYLFAGTYGSGVWRRPLSELVGVSKEANELPKDYTLSQNYPNPFNPSTVISYSLPSASNVKLIVYNTIGQTVNVLENKFKNADTYSVNFNAADLPSGIYFYKLEAGQFSQVKKMMVIK